MPIDSKKKLEEHLQKVFALPPNDLGNKWLTSIYKAFTGPLKQMTFFYILPFSLAIAIFMYLLLGQLVIKLVSLLQYGF